MIRSAAEIQKDDAPVQAAVNMALLDVLGKLAKTPLYEVLGGPTRNKVRALACLEASSEKELTAAVQQAQQTGFRAFAVPLLLPGGATRGRAFYRQAVRLLEHLRNAAGDGTDFVLDCGGRCTAAEAAGLARALEPFHLLWLDEPVGHIDRKSLARISAESVTPLGCGRSITENRDFLELQRLDAVDALRPDIALNGIGPIRKAAALAETYYVAVAPFHRGGPVATAAALHLAASIPNFFIQDIPFCRDERDQRMRRELVGADLEAVKDGFLALPQGPGLGISVNQEALQKYQVKS
jgi:galactonate dehydratase